MITGINHVGLVVNDVEEYAAFLKNMMGAEVVETVPFPAAGQTSCLVEFGDSKYELMSPLGEVEGVVGKFLAKHGQGFHHISLWSDDFDADVAALQEKGIKIVSFSEDRGTRYAFTHPKTSGGVLYEIAGK